MSSAEQLSTTSKAKSISIVGGGIVGASVAYYLSQRGIRSTIYEAHGVASAASGKAAGFLASDWSEGSDLDALSHASFALHEQLAISLGASEIGYRRVGAMSVQLAHPQAEMGQRKARTATDPTDKFPWLDGGVRMFGNAATIGTENTCAQVTPELLTHALINSACETAGSEVVIATVDNVQPCGTQPKGPWRLSIRMCSDDNRETCVEVVSDIVVLCMGPWTTHAKQWFQNLPAIVAQKAVSITIPDINCGSTALFTQYTAADGHVREPEVYPRERSVYLCMSGRPDDLPQDARRIVQVDRADVNELETFARTLSRKAGDLLMTSDNDEVRRTACFLPISPDGLPVIGKIFGVDDVFIGAGHSCWGILNGPATGKALAEEILDQHTSIFDMSPFNPQRFAS